MKCEIGILGGSFNPIHNGHIMLAREILKQKAVDKIWMLVSPQNPLKQETTLLPEKLRIELAKLAVKDDSPYISVSDFEFHLARPSYTFQTLRKLEETYSNCTFTLIIGADNWLNFNLWKNPEEILQHHNIIIYPRKGFKIDSSSLPQNVTLLNLPIFPISSTEIRKLLRQHKDASKWLHPEVIKQLYKSGIY